MKLRSAGYTLIELLIVVMTLTIIATIALPNPAATNPLKLDVVAAELANAIRFARSEAMRNQDYRSIEINQNTNDVILAKPLISEGDIVGTEYVLTHPIDKKAYQFNLGKNSAAAGVTINNPDDVFLFNSILNKPLSLFNAHGNPVYLLDDVVYGLNYATIELKIDRSTIKIVLSKTGRVTIE